VAHNSLLERESKAIDPARTGYRIHIMEHYDGPATAKLQDFQDERDGKRETPARPHQGRVMEDNASSSPVTALLP
jgi:hypothetical protein